MLQDLQRKLEIGSHSERLRTVRQLAELDSREAYGLLEIAMGDIDPQIQEEARRAMQSSCWYSGGGSAAKTAPEPRETEGQESFF